MKLMFIKLLFIILFYCQIMPTTTRDNYNLVDALVSRILFLIMVFGFDKLDILLFPISALSFVICLI